MEKSYNLRLKARKSLVKRMKKKRITFSNFSFLIPASEEGSIKNEWAFQCAARAQKSCAQVREKARNKIWNSRSFIPKSHPSEIIKIFFRSEKIAFFFIQTNGMCAIFECNSFRPCKSFAALHSYRFELFHNTLALLAILFFPRSFSNLFLAKIFIFSFVILSSIE